MAIMFAMCLAGLNVLKSTDTACRITSLWWRTLQWTTVGYGGYSGCSGLRPASDQNHAPTVRLGDPWCCRDISHCPTCMGSKCWMPACTRRYCHSRVCIGYAKHGYSSESITSTAPSALVMCLQAASVVLHGTFPPAPVRRISLFGRSGSLDGPICSFQGRPPLGYSTRIENTAHLQRPFHCIPPNIISSLPA